MKWKTLPRVKDCEEDSSSSSMSMYNLDFDGEDSNFPSNWSTVVVLHDAPPLMNVEEVHCSPITEKVPCERHVWFKKKIIPLVIISRKYLVVSLSTFTEKKSFGRELGK